MPLRIHRGFIPVTVPHIAPHPTPHFTPHPTPHFTPHPEPHYVPHVPYIPHTIHHNSGGYSGSTVTDKDGGVVLIVFTFAIVIALLARVVYLIHKGRL